MPQSGGSVVRILIAWELGANLGHLLRQMMIARVQARMMRRIGRSAAFVPLVTCARRERKSGAPVSRAAKGFRR